MIIPELKGRLGNQIFQICNAIAFAINNNEPYHIPAESANNEIWPAYFKHLQNPNYNIGIPTYRIVERSHEYQQYVLPDYCRGLNVWLVGYFQSEKYFAEHKPLLRKLLGFSEQPEEQYRKVASVHVRRGDYLQLKDHHPPVTEDYLDTAIDIAVGMGAEKVLGFSDDLEYIKDYFRRSKPNIAVEFISQEIPFEEMKLMQMCRYNIISNSTFSLIPAIFNVWPDKICISPHRDKWFGFKNAHLSTKDIIPNGFIQI
jgi:hypothetical protein